MSKKLNIAIVLDKSASMNQIQEATVKALNDQIETLHRESSDNFETNVSLVTFDSYVNSPIFWNIPLKELKKIKTKHYNPSGLTALNDAIGTTVLRLMNDDNENSIFLLIIITDGYENQSIFLKDVGLKNLIETFQCKENWTFTVLAANVPKPHFIKDLGIPENNVKVFEATEEGVALASSQLSDGLTSYIESVKSGETNVNYFYSD